MQNLDFSSLEDALKTFEEVIQKKNISALERDGVIQRFEYTFELCWKSIRKILLLEGRAEVSSSPKPLLREAHQENLIEDLDTWFAFIEARNRTSHTYHQKTAEQVYQDIQFFGVEARKLLEKLNERLKKN